MEFGIKTPAWTVEVVVMGRKALPATVVVEHQMEAWCLLDRIEEALITIRKAIWAAKHELEEANGILERVSRADDESITA